MPTHILGDLPYLQITEYTSGFRRYSAKEEYSTKIPVGAIYPVWNRWHDENNVMLRISEMSKTNDPNNKRIYKYKCQATYFNGRDEMEARIKDFCSSKEARNYWYGLNARSGGKKIRRS